MPRSSSGVDTSQFDSLFREYAKLSKKSNEDIVRAKLQDLCYKAGKHLPKANEELITGYLYLNPKFVTYVTNKRFGMGSWDREDWADTWERLRRSRRAAISFMKSVLFKMGKETRAAGITRPGKQKANPNSLKGRNAYLKAFVDFKVKRGTSTPIIGSVRGEQQANEGKGPMSPKKTNDAQKKEAILNAALVKAVPVVRRDMVVYIERKIQADLNKATRKAIQGARRAFS